MARPASSNFALVNGKPELLQFNHSQSASVGQLVRSSSLKEMFLEADSRILHEVRPVVSVQVSVGSELSSVAELINNACHSNIIAPTPKKH
jgi:hypothetical protein